MQGSLMLTDMSEMFAGLL